MRALWIGKIRGWCVVRAGVCSPILKRNDKEKHIKKQLNKNNKPKRHEQMDTPSNQQILTNSDKLQLLSYQVNSPEFANTTKMKSKVAIIASNSK